MQDTAASQAIGPIAHGISWVTVLPAWIQALAAIGALLVIWLLKKQVDILQDQLRLTKDQLESGVKWNRLNAAFTFFHSEVVLSRERAAAAALHKLGINLYNTTEALPPEIISKILRDWDALADVRDFLSLVEDYATGIHHGAIDEDAAFAMMSGLIIRWSTVFRPFIEARRLEVHDRLAYSEFDQLAERWRIRDGQDAVEPTNPSRP